jgi:glycosyltransferase involved in cell wall biosynthesis
MKRVLFLYQDREMPSSRIRVLNVVPHLPAYEIVPSVEAYPATVAEKLRLFRRLREFDVVFLQKKMPTPPEIAMIRRLARKLVFDFDDAIYYRDGSRGSFDSTSRYLKFKSVVRRADLVVAGNAVIGGFASRFNSSVVVVPSAVALPARVKDYAATGTPVVGWVGSRGNLPHLMMLAPVLQKLASRHEMVVNVICSERISIPGVRVRFVPWSLESEEREIARFDIGVMPLPANKWTEGKCGYKVLQYMASGVPPVCSDVGGNRDIVEHGKDGFLASSDDDFLECLETLINNMQLRRQMGMLGRKKVRERFSIEVVAARLGEILNRI